MDEQVVGGQRMDRHVVEPRGIGHFDHGFQVAHTPACIALAKAHPHDPDGCFLIDTYPARGYFLAVAAVVLWLVCGVDGGPTHKYIHAKLEPADAPPPTCRA